MTGADMAVPHSPVTAMTWIITLTIVRHEGAKEDS
jgi:hypothetical protein